MHLGIARRIPVALGAALERARQRLLADRASSSPQQPPQPPRLPETSSLPVVHSCPRAGGMPRARRMTEPEYPKRSAVPPASDSRGRRLGARAASLHPRAGRAPGIGPLRAATPPRERGAWDRGLPGARALPPPATPFSPPAGPVRQAKLDRRLSSRRSAPRVRRSRPAARRGRPRRRRRSAARSSGRPGPRRPARAAAWPPRQRDRKRQHAELAVGLHALGVERVAEEDLASVGPLRPLSHDHLVALTRLEAPHLAGYELDETAECPHGTDVRVERGDRVLARKTSS